MLSRLIGYQQVLIANQLLAKKTSLKRKLLLQPASRSKTYPGPLSNSYLCDEFDGREARESENCVPGRIVRAFIYLRFGLT